MPIENFLAVRQGEPQPVVRHLPVWERGAHAAAQAVADHQEIGSLGPGKLADLIVVDEHLLTGPVDAIREIRPVAT
jgi:predicted amidohydrolase YtcJ